MALTCKTFFAVQIPGWCLYLAVSDRCEPMSSQVYTSRGSCLTLSKKHQQYFQL